MFLYISRKYTHIPHIHPTIPFKIILYPAKKSKTDKSCLHGEMA